MRARLSLAVLITLLLLRSAATAEVAGKKSDVEFLLGFLAGNYRLIGQKPDSGAAYSGRLTLQRRGRAFHVIRTIDRATAEGTALDRDDKRGHRRAQNALPIRWSGAGGDLSLAIRPGQLSAPGWICLPAQESHEVTGN